MNWFYNYLARKDNLITEEENNKMPKKCKCGSPLPPKSFYRYENSLNKYYPIKVFICKQCGQVTDY